MELLRWFFFIPSAAAGGMFGFIVGFIIAILAKLLNRNLEGDNPFVLLPMACALTYCWFVGGMRTSPRNVDPRKILFILTVIIIFALGVMWAPLVYWFDATEFADGNYVRFIWVPLGIILTTAWIWFSKQAKEDPLLQINRKVIALQNQPDGEPPI